MTIVRQCTIALPILFWQIVNLATFGYSVAFLFWPDDAAKMFNTAPNKELVRFIGVQFLLISAGANQMLASTVFKDAVMQKASYLSSVFEFLMGGIAGIVVLSFEEEPFTAQHRFVFLMLFSFFTGALFLGLFFNCRGYISLTRKAPELTEVVTDPTERKIPNSRADIYRAAGRN